MYELRPVTSRCPLCLQRWHCCPRQLVNTPASPRTAALKLMPDILCTASLPPNSLLPAPVGSPLCLCLCLCLSLCLSLSLSLYGAILFSHVILGGI